ncbi:hypothetical protein BT63DRAFT_59600 [Microthyrium microscopicum]|uniref:Uncharacterized protein n=1 Tax=Microthyrium microscopicum TaxID=703497 RepID=A0A6A6U4F5_9PEZI|nr:hypothetical protein BT63DRAFT_59600 [Microthyrium microscopicum]
MMAVVVNKGKPNVTAHSPYPQSHCNDLSLVENRVSGQFCDTLRRGLDYQKHATPEQECSDCVLDEMVTILNSPFGYDSGYEEDFHSRTSSCSKTAYTFTDRLHIRLLRAYRRVGHYTRIQMSQLAHSERARLLRVYRVAILCLYLVSIAI